MNLRNISLRKCDKFLGGTISIIGFIVVKVGQKRQREVIITPEKVVLPSTIAVKQSLSKPNQVKFCPECGQEVKGTNQRFCMNCGFEFEML